MPASETIDHHKPIKYVRVGVLAGESFTVTESADGKKITVSGTCPACGGSTTWDISYGLGGTGYKGWRGRPKSPPVPPEAATMTCDCGHHHPDRPSDTSWLGCGRSWTVALRVP